MKAIQQLMMQLDGLDCVVLIALIIGYAFIVYLTFQSLFDAKKRDDFNKGQNKIK